MISGFRRDGTQRPELALELLGIEPLLAVTREDRLDGGIASLHGLKCGQCCFHPILGQMVEHGVGFLAGRHSADCTPVLMTPIGALRDADAHARAPVVRQCDTKTAGFSRRQPDKTMT